MDWLVQSQMMLQHGAFLFIGAAGYKASNIAKARVLPLVGHQDIIYTARVPSLAKYEYSKDAVHEYWPEFHPLSTNAITKDTLLDDWVHAQPAVNQRTAISTVWVKTTIFKLTKWELTI